MITRSHEDMSKKSVEFTDKINATEKKIKMILRNLRGYLSKMVSLYKFLITS